MSSDRLTQFYEAFDEESRLSQDNTHRVEFITTTQVLDHRISGRCKILDVAAGVGRYAFYYSSKGHLVWAQDISVRHVERMRSIVQERGIVGVDFALGDARDLTRFDGCCFDVVLCMGPIYHVADEEKRIDCLRESLRVLKPNGLLAVTYLNTPIKEDPLFSSAFGGVRADSCFFTSSPESMERMLRDLDLRIVDHVAADGISRQVREPLNRFGEEEFKHWIEFNLRVCRSPVAFSYNYNGLLVCTKPGDTGMPGLARDGGAKRLTPGAAVRGGLSGVAFDPVARRGHVVPRPGTQHIRQASS